MKSAKEYSAAIRIICSLCLVFSLATAPLVSADDTGASSTTPVQTDSTTTPPTGTSNDASTTPLSDSFDSIASTTPDTNDASSTSDTSTSSDPSITTGDASSDAEVNNEINTNKTDTDAASTIENTNDATTTNDASSTAQTGGNDASGTGSATISTGDAISQANVINVVNTNITNSEGLLEFLNAFGASGYDLRNLGLSYFDASSSGADCSFSSCGASSTSLTVDNSNDATVTNDVVSEASTGGNTADSSNGNANISTGNAAASANVVNVVNTNITNSHYLLVALNNFGDLAGNIILPSASFFDQLMHQNLSTAATTVQNDNSASLDSTTTADADTGGNGASGDAGGITTGNALSNATTFNQVNTNTTGGSTVFMLVNVFGDWTGGIKGLPGGLSWMPTQNGVAITGGESTLSSLGETGTTTVSDTNAADVHNDVQVYALTGQNEADSSGTTTIATGNAYASANVVNLVNTNILGENWMLAIMNVFGNWSGDLDFGQPDLWIGAEAQTTNPTEPGSSVVYTFTVANHGDSDATNVDLSAQFDPTMLTFDSGMTKDGAAWDLGTIPAGQTKQFSYTATAGDPPGGLDAVPLTATVSENEDDANLSDNSDTVTIAVGDQFTTSGIDIGQYQAAPQLTIHKTASLAKSTAPVTVNYTVTVDDADDAGPAYGAMLSDTLKGPKGDVLYQNSWELDTINPGDEITLTYSIQYAASSTPGAYLDTSEVTGYQNYTELPYANVMPPVSAISAFEIVPGGEVLGASTSTAPACAPLLDSYIMVGGHNDRADVSGLQWFLNTFEDASLSVSGVYDAATQAAVKAFQQKYAEEILAPWGMTKPSGNVYYTTENAINNLVCGETQFSLTQSELREMEDFKTTGGTYGAGAGSTHVAKKNPPAPVLVFFASSTPVVFPDYSASPLKHVLEQLTSALGVPFAQAASRN